MQQLVVALYKTTNGGANWINITVGLPSGSAQISRVAVDNTDENKVFVTLSGYSSANKVYSKQMEEPPGIIFQQDYPICR
jgi:hypothetical protein